MKQPKAETVLKRRFISYCTPLKIARDWGRDNGAEYREQALILLEGLFEQYPHAIEIAEELALSYLEGNDDVRAQAVLDEIQLLSRSPHEEVLARRGRIFRDKADHFVTYPVYVGPPEVKIGGPFENLAEALRYFKLALEQYTQSYEIRLGHYPGVNVATLNLLIAAFTSEAGERTERLEKCRSTAKQVISRRQNWPRDYDDDDVWHAASAGEMQLLLQDWPAALENYRHAQAHAKCKAFHRTSMLKQVIRIIYGYMRLGVTSLGAFDKLTNVFPPDSAE